ncbi:MAG: glutamate synthase subunit alpha, partial [Verrucomicrobia bacterium]|nr:glutamate synthase subunit alpha [Verrucomicrobiota bacterium]
MSNTTINDVSQPAGVFRHGRPKAHGLYHPSSEKDGCGVGFIAHIKGLRTHKIVEDALTMLQHMDHRGACGCEANTGDGAGIQTALPHRFLAKVALTDAGITLPEPGHYGCGIVFLPPDPSQRARCRFTLETCIAEQGQQLLGWRPVPQNNSMIGDSAKAQEPVMEMLFVGGNTNGDGDALERQLLIIRKMATRLIRNE